MDNDTDPTIPSVPSTPTGASEPMRSKIRKQDKIAIMTNISNTFARQFPQLESEDINGLTRYFGDHMCRKIAKTPLYQTSGTVTVQSLRDAFGAVLAERVLHRDIDLRDSVPTTPAAAYMVCGVDAPFGSPATATTESEASQPTPQEGGSPALPPVSGPSEAQNKC